MSRLELSSAIGWGFPTWKEPDMIAMVRGFGIRHVQVFRNREKRIPANEIRGRIEDAGLRITSLHAFFGPEYDPTQEDEAARALSVENLVREADYVLGLGGDLVIVHPGCDETGGSPQDEPRVAALRRSAAELARWGEDKGVVFALENLPPGHVGCDMAMLRSVADEVDSAHLGLNYDCGHANLSGDPVAALEAAGERVVGTHIHDNHGSADEHLPPGFGDVDMEAVCRTLARCGYRGDFTLELMETVASLRSRLDGQWTARLAHWLDLASGIAS